MRFVFMAVIAAAAIGCEALRDYREGELPAISLDDAAATQVNCKPCASNELEGRAIFAKGVALRTCWHGSFYFIDPPCGEEISVFPEDHPAGHCVPERSGLYDITGRLGIAADGTFIIHFANITDAELTPAD